ncbi:MAG: condensation domain-containing protein, partial [Psychrosphaera sp.]|nr:condensation domain-containing protein [Psychrosphaera sp.]
TNVEQIQQQLRQHLADYMIPPQIYALDILPLTANNKIDRKALLALEADVLSQGLEQSYVAPRNDLEQQLTKIWQGILGLERIGVKDNFFTIGGHSIKATLLVTQLSKALSIEFSLKEVFETPTIAGLAHKAQFKQPSLYAQIEKAPVQVEFELSYAQKRLWTLDKVQGGNHAYNLHGAFVVKSAVDRVVDKSKIEQAFGYLVARHDALRLAFVEVDGTPYQKVQSADRFKMLTQQVNSVEQATALCRQEIEHTFDLAQGDLFRVKLFVLPDSSLVMSLCLHHIIADGWSIGVLLNEFSTVYGQLCTGAAPDLTPLPIQYSDFTHWQNEAIRSAAINSQRDYWLMQLSGDLPVLELPTDYPRPAEKSFVGEVLHFDLPQPVFNQLQAFNESKKLTLFMGLIGFYHLTLFKYTGQQQIIIGIPISGRYHPDLNGQIGYYLNTLPIKLDVEATDTLESYFKRLKETVKNAFDNQVYPFDELMGELNIENNPGRSGLYDVMFGLQNFDQGELKLENATGEVLAVDSPTSKFDLTMVCEENAGNLSVNLEYATDLFNPQTIEQLQQHFVQLMQSALATPQSNIGQLSVLSDNEREQILKGFNAEANQSLHGGIVSTNDHGIIDIFKACVGKHAHKTALAFGTETMSYVQLDEWSNQIAYTLLNSHTIKPQDRIAIYADRSPWMIACILAVLKSGAAYVPIDPKNPKARTEFMLQDSQSRLVLTHSHYLNDLESMALPLLTKQDTVRGVKSPLKMTYQPDHLAYIMYTSGSSGTPKGVLVEQQSVIALVKDNNYSNVTEQDRLLQLSNYAFDGSIFDIFSALLSGASLHLIDNDMLLSPDRLCEFIKDQQVNITFITTALINTLIDIEPQIISQFDKIYFGGQEASLKHIQTALDYRKNADSIVHVYGPTETTTFASYHVVESIDSKVGNIPIGRALSQKQLYLLDEQMQPVPVGVTGEIYIGGAGVARAYLNRPKETT